MIGTIIFWLIVIVIAKVVMKPGRFLQVFTPDYPAKINTATGVALGILVIGFNVFIYGVTNNYPMTWGVVGINLTMLVIWALMIEKSKWGLLQKILAVVSVLASLALTWRANSFVQQVNYSVVFGAQILLFVTMVFDKIFFEVLWMAKNSVRMILKAIGLPVLGRKSLTPSDIKVTASKSWIVKNLIGFVITLGVSLAFMGIYTSADPVFSKMTEKLMSEVVPRIFASLGIAVIGLWALSLRQKADHANRWGVEKVEFGYVFAPLLSVAVITALFLFVQAKYLFASQEVFKAMGVTYSQYVRKGFVELLVAAGAGGFLTYFLILKQRALDNTKLAMALKVLGSFFVVEMWLLLASAYRRDLMYMDAYGMTRVRVIGTVFLLWLLCVLVLLFVLNLKRAWSEAKYFVGVGIASLFVWGYLNTTNIDYLVARAAPEHNTYTDYFYLVNMSEDIGGNWEGYVAEMGQKMDPLMAKSELTEEEKAELAGYKLALISLNEKAIGLLKKYATFDWKMTHYNELYKDDAQSKNFEISQARIEEVEKEIADYRAWNFTEVQIETMIEINSWPYLIQLPEMVEKIKRYQSLNGIDLYAQENRVLNEFKYPFMNVDLNYYPMQMDTYNSSELLNPANFATLNDRMAKNPHIMNDDLGRWLTSQNEPQKFVVLAWQIDPNIQIELPSWASRREQVLIITDKPGMKESEGYRQYAKLVDQICDSCILNSIFSTSRNLAFVKVEMVGEVINGVNVPVVKKMEEVRFLR